MTASSFLEYLDEHAASWQALDEAGLSRILTHLNARNIGFVSAFRGGSATPLQDNRANNRQLQNDIRSAGYGFLRLNGSWPENEGTPEEVQVEEESFLVIGKDGDDSGNLLGFLKKMGAKYKQDAILYKPWKSKTVNLIMMSNPKDLRPLGPFSLNPADIGKMYSTFRGHPFVFKKMSESRGFFGRLAYHGQYT